MFWLLAISFAVLFSVALLVAYYNWNVLHDSCAASVGQAAGAAFLVVWIFGGLEILFRTSSMLAHGNFMALGIFSWYLTLLISPVLLITGTISAFKSRRPERGWLFAFSAASWLLWLGYRSGIFF